MKTIYDFFVYDVVIELTKDEFELPRALGKLIQTAKLTGENDQAGDFHVEIHGGELKGVWRPSHLLYRASDKDPSQLASIRWEANTGDVHGGARVYLISIIPSTHQLVCCDVGGSSRSPQTS